MKFRTDINGLRTYAVLAVIIFHFNKSWLPGGFAGVDVFFVISGYLMTSIIFRGLEKQSFSLWKFYSARIRRIIPALLVLIVILMVFGYLFLAPIPYADLAKHSGGSLLFISNIMYWQESGYFDATAIEKFLLHTWSLSVEWQFYIIYPLGLLILSKILKVETLKKLVVIGTVLSLIFAIYASQRWSVASYFLLPTRVWEMLLGGIAFLYPFELRKQSEKHMLELSGLALIVVSFFIINENISWPGYAALIPTLGTFILLQSNNEKSIFTNNPIAQKIGLWSYSLYLYHWPLLAVSFKLNLQLSFWLYLLITLLLATASYYFIEVKKWKVKHVIIFSFSTLAVTLAVYISNGASFRMGDAYNLSKEEYREKNYAVAMYPESSGQAFSINTENSQAEYILAGDSYAMQYLKYIDDKKIPLVSIARPACLLIPNYSTGNSAACDETYEIFQTMLEKNKETNVILAQSWLAYGGEGRLTPLKDIKPQKNYEKLLINEIEEIISTGGSNRNYYLIGRYQSPLINSSECALQRKLILNRLLLKSCNPIQGIYHIGFNDRLKDLSDKYDHVYFIDLNPATCNGEFCQIIINENPIHFDNDHLSTYGADIVGQYIFDEIKKIENNK